MDSLPQELIDAIINNLPRSSLRSSSLVARRWRTTSQQRNFVSITFRSQDNVYHWLSNVQSGQNKIVPYIRSAQFRNISSWNKPTLFCRALQGFCSLTTLSVYRSMIPDELLGHISRGEFGRGITALYLEYPQCELSTIISMILSLPDLRKLVAKSGGTTSSQQPSTSSVAPCRGPFDLLGLYYGANGIAEALIQSRIASRYICLGAAISGVHQLLALSSESLKVLMLEDSLVRTPIPVIDLPSFPALTSLRLRLFGVRPSHRLITILSSVSSTPKLTSIDIQRAHYNADKPAPSDTWDDLDRWLARATKHATAGCGPVLTLRRYLFSESFWEALLPKFKEAGGQIKIHADGWIDYD